MGKKDSSKTRVEPVFDRLVNQHETGFSWLPELIGLPEGGNSINNSPETDYTIHDYGWGTNEKKLLPPVALLSWLIRNPSWPLDGKLSNNNQKAEKREKLIEGSQELVHEGLELLRYNPHNEGWHIFEGDTQPDVYIETEDLILVIEGKRTESRPTTHTKWMPTRHQMIRHIDCAWEIRGRKQVVGFFIVEGGGEATEPPLIWQKFANDTVKKDNIVASLPHRGEKECREIASCFIGVTTWQRVCREFGIEWADLPDEC